MGRQFLESLAGTPFWEGQQKVFSKIRAALGESGMKSLKKLAPSLPNSASRTPRKSNAVFDASSFAELMKTTAEISRIAKTGFKVASKSWPGSSQLTSWGSRRDILLLRKDDGNLQIAVPQARRRERSLEEIFIRLQLKKSAHRSRKLRATFEATRSVQTNTHSFAVVEHLHFDFLQQQASDLLAIFDSRATAPQ